MAPQLLPREDPDAVEVLKRQLVEDGVKVHTGIKILSISRVGGSSADSDDNHVSLYCSPWGIYTVAVEINGERVELQSEALLNATGRAPNVHGIGLEKVGVDWDNRQGVHVNEFFRTNNPDIYACGDCTSAYKFTHSADFQARMAVRNMFLGDVSSSKELLIPWCTYTEPEIAHVGKYESELKAAGVEFETFTRQIKDVDRCMCDGITEGFVKITVKADTMQIIGCTICAPHAGDMISEVTLAMQYGITVPQIAGTIHPYPTTQEAIRQACLGYNKYYKNPSAVPLVTLRKVMEENGNN